MQGVAATRRAMYVELRVVQRGPRISAMLEAHVDCQRLMACAVHVHVQMHVRLHKHARLRVHVHAHVPVQVHVRLRVRVHAKQCWSCT